MDLLLNLAQGIAFLSTPSVGRATLTVHRFSLLPLISIHALRGEGDRSVLDGGQSSEISIHALRGEGDR